jgi:hypothetical protein
MRISRWWLLLNDHHEPNPAELREQFSCLPLDPRTGYPIGYLWFALELDHRRAEAAEAARELAEQSGMEFDRRISVGNREFIEDLRRQAQESARRRK